MRDRFLAVVLATLGLGALSSAGFAAPPEEVNAEAAEITPTAQNHHGNALAGLWKLDEHRSGGRVTVAVLSDSEGPYLTAQLFESASGRERKFLVLDLRTRERIEWQISNNILHVGLGQDRRNLKAADFSPSVWREIVAGLVSAEFYETLKGAAFPLMNAKMLSMSAYLRILVSIEETQSYYASSVPTQTACSGTRICLRGDQTLTEIGELCLSCSRMPGGGGGACSSCNQSIPRNFWDQVRNCPMDSCEFFSDSECMNCSFMYEICDYDCSCARIALYSACGAIDGFCQSGPGPQIRIEPPNMFP